MYRQPVTYNVRTHGRSLQGNGRWQLAHFLKAIRLAMDWAIEHHAVFDFLAHPSCLGVVDPDFQTLDLICDLVEQAKGEAEIVSLDKIAQRIQ